MGIAIFVSVFAGICFLGLVAAVLLLSQDAAMPELQTRDVEVRETTTSAETQALLPGLACLLSVMAILVFCLVIWVVAFVNCITRHPSEGSDKMLWVLVLILLGFFGALLYICFAWKGPDRRYYPARRY